MQIHVDPYAKPPPGMATPGPGPRAPRPPEGPSPPPRRRGLRLLAALLLALITVNVGLLGWLLYRPGTLPRAPLQTAQPQLPRFEIEVSPGASPSTPLPDDLAPGEERNIEIFRQAAPSVVFITNIAVSRGLLSRKATEIPRGTGSGFVWDDQGHVVTNFHVIRGGNAAKVTFSNQKEYDAKVVGMAPDKDIAVLKIEAPADALVALPRGSSSNLVVGQQTFAIGNPFGLDHTLSTGVVSGLEREIDSLVGRPIFGVIQTDAAINPGNSGGPLLDSSGRLIGINTAIYSPSGASAGIGFAVPVDTVTRIVPQLIEYGKVIRPGLGITFDPVLNQRTGEKGIIVLTVQPDSAADDAGLRPTTRDGRTGDIILGDIIFEIDGASIETEKDLFKQLDDKEVGDTLKLKVRRGDEERALELTLKELPVDAAPPRRRGP
ncbi:MAG: trypsin-like peptidase domain-containing protein [Myxococcota bacterium]